MNQSNSKMVNQKTICIENSIVDTSFNATSYPSKHSKPIPFTANDAINFINQIRTKRPLTHCITNTVVQNFSANILHAIGAVPAMNVMNEEVESFVAISQALLVNFGTLSYEIAENMKRAAISANRHSIPWVLDPVAIGSALVYRTDLAEQMVAFNPTAIRANPSEILTLAKQKGNSKGPDGLDSSEQVFDIAIALAKEHQTIIAMTDKTDFITDGSITYSIHLGSDKLTRVTGTGCALSALVAAFLGASSPDDYLKAVASACFVMAYAGDKASSKAGLGSFSVELIDQISLLNESNLKDKKC